MNRHIVIKNNDYWWVILDTRTGHTYGPGVCGFDRKRDARRVAQTWANDDPPGALEHWRSGGRR